MKHRHFFNLFKPFLPFLFFTLSTAAAPPAQLSQWLHDLDNADPAVREEAKQNLMALHRPDLDALRQIVAQSPLSPEQVTSLHEIVTQVILSEAATLGAPNGHGFLGAQPLECQVPMPDGKTRPAILIAHLVAGFDAYRMLRTGDIILSIDGNSQFTQNLPSFMTTIQSHTPGDQLHLQILRGGKNMDVAVQLFTRPPGADNINAFDLTENPEDRIKEYWSTTFEPIIHKRNAD